MVIAVAPAAAKPGTSASDWEYRKTARVAGVRACVDGATPGMRARIDMIAMCGCTMDGIMARYPVKVMMTAPRRVGLTLAEKDIARSCLARYAPKDWKP